MVNYFLLTVTSLLFQNYYAFNPQMTHLKPRNPRDIFLKRHKRVVTFPDGSNFVLTISIVKAIMVKIPKGWNIILECDVPFKLPTIEDYKHIQMPHTIHHHQRREIYDTLIETFVSLGLDGIACIEYMRCEANYLKNIQNRTLIEDLLIAIFTYPKFSSYVLNDTYGLSEEICMNALKNCQIPMLNFLLNPND